MTANLKNFVCSTILLTASAVMSSPVQAQKASLLSSPLFEDKGHEIISKEHESFSQLTLDVDDPTWCYGWDEVTNTCQLYFGSKQSCESLTQCQPSFYELASRENDPRATQSLALETDDPTWCYGWDEDTNSCQLYLGSKQSCEHLDPCRPNFYELAPREKEVRERQAEEQATFARLALEIDDPTWCYGWDEDVNSCQLYFGSKSSCETLDPCPQTLAYLAPAKDLTQFVDRGPEAAGDVCDGCDNCVYGCCWDSWPVPCNTLTAE
ncbi:MAG: hypothetical protein AB7G75_35610 [Candidatus Binatia bacterium]